MPIDLEQAALIDGCSEFQAFYKILLPLSLPALAIVFLFNFLAAWGEYFTARVLIGSSEELLTWPLGIQQFQDQFQSQWADLSASAIIVSVPIVILFVYISKYLVSGLTLGGVKGSVPGSWPQVALLIVLAASPAGAALTATLAGRASADRPGRRRRHPPGRPASTTAAPTCIGRPGGAVPAGSPVTPRIRAAAGDLGSAEVRVTDHCQWTPSAGAADARGDRSCGGEHGYDYWAATWSRPRPRTSCTTRSWPMTAGRDATCQTMPRWMAVLDRSAASR